MNDASSVKKIDLNKTDWRGSREFFESLADELRSLDDKEEKYDFTWVGKRKSIIEAGAPINKTLRPDLKSSKNWDSTENLFIEGDNLDALKLLQESYLGKVKMIYIDPPYNTGKDFVFHDNFKVDVEQYDEATEYKDEEGNIQFKKNEKSNGRYHSDWLSMMYPRLKLARNLLSDDGVILISIDDNEEANLRKLCDEIFGEDNFVASLTWEKKKKGTFLSNTITNVKEYICVYSKNKPFFKGLIGEINEDTETYPCINAANKRSIISIPAGIKSKFREKNYRLSSGGIISDTTMNLVLHSDLVIEDGILTKELAIEGNWRYTQDKMTEFATKGELYLTQDLYLRRIVSEPRYKTLKDLLSREGDDRTSSHRDVNLNNLFADGWGSNEDAEEELRLLLGVQGIMDFPKPLKLIEKLIISLRDENVTVLDFFAGSGTTAHAVMKLNSEDGGNRKWIMVQLPEETPEGSEARKAGFNSIPEIARERIRRAADKIAKERPDAKVDYGFRSLKIDYANYKEVYKPVSEISQESLLDTVDNIKEDRSDLDLLYGVLTQLAWELNRPISSVEIDGLRVYLYDYKVSDKTLRTIKDKGGKSITVANQGMVACFEENISENVIKQIAQMEPKIVVFRDSSFADSQAKVNLAEHFRVISPDTKVRVI